MKKVFVIAVLFALLTSCAVTSYMDRDTELTVSKIRYSKSDKKYYHYLTYSLDTDTYRIIIIDDDKIYEVGEKARLVK